MTDKDVIFHPAGVLRHPQLPKQAIRKTGTPNPIKNLHMGLQQLLSYL